VYEASVEILSYKTKKLNITEVNRDFNIGNIYLEVDTKMLGEVNIVAEKSSMDVKKDKLVFNVGKDIAASGSTASQILSNIPSVEVDPSGKLTLSGRDNVTIMINGRTSTLSKSDVLNSLPAGTIEKVEVIKNPGASYAANLGAIINIILKKGKDEGLNASLTGSAGYKDYYGTLLNLNNKTKKVNFFTNINYAHRNPIKNASYDNTYFNNGNISTYLNENSRVESPANTFIGSIGADYFLSKKATLTTTINYTDISNKTNGNTYTELFDNNKNVTGTNNRISNRTFNDEIIELIADYVQKFREGEKLTVNLSYSNDKEHFRNEFSNTNTDFFTDNFQIKNKLENTNAKVKYNAPLKNNAGFEIGYEGNYGYTPYQYYSNSENNIINFKDTNHSFFASFEQQIKKWYYGLELRGEFLKYNIDYLYNNTNQIKNFNNLFPYAVVDYSIADNKSLTLSYGRKYGIPGYSQFQPFEQKLSEIISFKGNPDLNPRYDNTFNLSYTYYGSKLVFRGNLTYTLFTDNIQNVTYVRGSQINGAEKLLSSIFNVGKLKYLTLDLTSIYKPIKNLSFTSNVVIGNFNQSGLFQITNEANNLITQDFSNKFTDFQFSLLTKLKIPRWFTIQSNIKHFTISKGPVSTRQPYTFANFAISKDLFDKNGTFSITSSDLFNSNRLKRTRYDTYYTSDIYRKNVYPTIIASFTYRFNQKKQDRKINFNKKEKESQYKF
ncbi:MAG: TonB-dependent receptor domain-containing protein, partial [Lutibacter sp.]